MAVGYACFILLEKGEFMPVYGDFGGPILGELALNQSAGFSALLGAGPSAAIALAMGLSSCLPLVLPALRRRPRLAPVVAVRAGRRA